MHIGGLDLRLRPYPSAAVVGPFGGHATLTDNLVSYWNMDETSGVRADLISTNNLSDNNTVGSDVGKRNNAATFVSGSMEFLSKSDWSGYDSFTISLWVDPGSTVTTNETFVHASGATWPTTQQFVAYPNAGVTRVLMSTATASFVFFDSAVALATDTFHHLLIWYDNTDSKARISVNGETPVVSSAFDNYQVTQTLRFGSQTASVLGYFTGLIDEVGFWSRALTIDERADLYNSGAGLFYEN